MQIFKVPVFMTMMSLAGIVNSTVGAQDMDHQHEPQASSGLGVDYTDSEVVVTTAPVHLPSMDPAMEHHGDHGAVFPPVETFAMPVHGYLRGFDYRVVDGAGNVLPREIVHHFNIIDPVHRELFLPISQRLLAAGQETGAQSMPRLLFGVPVYLGQEFVVTAMLHNPTGEEHHDVSLEVTFKYVKVGRPWPLFEVYPFQLDVAFPAGDKSFDLPPGQSSKSWEGSPSRAGRIMVIGSHLHDLATHITFEDITEGETLWTGYPLTDENGRIEGVTIGHVYRKLGLKITPDHTYRITVYYDNPSADTLMSGGMGVVAGVFMPSGGGIWPRADTGNELYALDRQHYMREIRGRYDVIAEGEIADSSITEAVDHVHDE